MGQIIRFNPEGDLSELHRAIVEHNSYYRKLKLGTLRQCKGNIYLYFNSKDDIIGIIAIRRLTYNDAELYSITKRRDPNYLYKIEVLDTFFMGKETEDNIKEYHVLFGLLSYAIKYVNDLSICIKYKTNYCSVSLMNALKNNKFVIQKIDQDNASYIRY